MLQQDKPEDYVLATGTSKTVRQFVELAFAEVGITLEWSGTGVEETGICKASGKMMVRVDPRYFRPTEVDSLLGDASKAFRDFGWKAEVTLDELVTEMVKYDIAHLKTRTSDI